MAESSNTTTSSLQNESTTKSTGNSSSGTKGFSLGNSLSKVSSSLSNSLLPKVSFSNTNTPGANKGYFSFSSNIGWIPTVSAPGTKNESSSGSTTNVATGTTYNSSTGTTNVSDESALEKILKVDDVWSTDSSDSSDSFTESPKVSRTSDTESGDYQASSNEKSEVKTDTLGKQSDIVTSPTLVEENKSLVNNSTIESVEGIITKQKDKASQEVLDASKKRNKAEEEDKTDKIKNQLNANDDMIKNPSSPTNNDIDPAFKAEDDKRQNDLSIKEQVIYQKQQELDNKKLVLNQKQQELDGISKDRDLMQGELDSFSRSIEDQEREINNLDQTYDRIATEIKETNKLNFDDGIIKGLFKSFDITKAIVKYVDELNKLSYNNGSSFKIDDPRKINMKELYQQVAESKNIVLYIQNRLLDQSRADLADKQNKLNEMNDLHYKISEEIGVLQKDVDNAQNDFNNAQNDFNNAQEEYKAWRASNTIKAPETTPETTVEPEIVEEEIITKPAVETPATEYSSSLLETADSLLNQYKGEEWAEEAAQDLKNLYESKSELHNAIKDIEEKGLENCTPEEINDYIEAQKIYNNNIKAALNNGRAYEQHDFNKEFVTEVAKANDFDVTLPDGSTISYSDFATNMVVKSPQIAEAMYNAKAEQYERNGHKILATIERAKAKIAQTFLGSKLTFADNKVRDQFNQMADTNMRATYAAYNNVLNNPNASDADKAEASTQISQAQSLKTASTALKASTGFLSGLGDSTSDGVYGTVDSETLNTYQKTLNGIKSFAQIALGLGVSPAANKAYQNLYYLNKDYPNKEGSILAKDFDKDGFAWVEEYGNNAAAGMILAGGELATGIALMFNPTTIANGTNLILDSIANFMSSLYGVRGNAVKASSMTEEILSYFNEAKTLNGLPSEAKDTIDNAIVQIENFELKADEVANLDNWLEGSGSNTADNNKFNQSLTYDEWLKLIESDETLRNYAKQLVDKKKEEKV